MPNTLKDNGRNAASERRKPGGKPGTRAVRERPMRARMSWPEEYFSLAPRCGSTLNGEMGAVIRPRRTGEGAE